MNQVVSKSNLFALFIAVLFMTGGCQSFLFQPISAEEAIENRVVEMMSARVNGDWGRVYKYLCPEYKNAVSKESFMAKPRNMLFRNFNVESVEMDSSAEKATVIVSYDMTVMSYEVPDQRETQKWIRKGGNWYFVIKNVSPFGGVD